MKFVNIEQSLKVISITYDYRVDDALNLSPASRSLKQLTWAQKSIYIFFSIQEMDFHFVSYS